MQGGWPHTETVGGPLPAPTHRAPPAGLYPGGGGVCSPRTPWLLQPSLASTHSPESAGTLLQLHLLLGMAFPSLYLSILLITCLKPVFKGLALGVFSVEYYFLGSSNSSLVDWLNFIFFNESSRHHPITFSFHISAPALWTPDLFASLFVAIHSFFSF